MPNVTVAVDQELKDRMDDHQIINWSAVARQAFERKLEDLEALEKMDEIAAESELTEDDVAEIAEQINQNIADRIDHGTFGDDHFHER